MRRITAIAVLMLLALPAVAGGPTGDAIVAGMKRAFAPINDYRADISLTVKGPQVSINNMTMTLYFKKPNKVHIEARQGFALMPGGTYLGNPIEELASGAHATYLRTEPKQGRECYVLDMGSSRPGMLLWVDKERSVIVAAEGPGAFKTSWQYAKIDGKYYLPAEIRAEMPNPRGASNSQPVKATIKFSNYRVNKGIDDKIFQEKNPSSPQRHRRAMGMRRYRH